LAGVTNILNFNPWQWQGRPNITNHPFKATVSKALTFLQTVGQASGKNDPATSSVSRRGRPSLGSYQEPDGAEEFAFSTRRIEENYPFFGTLMRREGGTYRRKEVIGREQARTIDYVKDTYGAGAYQLRLKTSGGAEQQINFNVSGVEKAEPDQATRSWHSTTTRFMDFMVSDIVFYSMNKLVWRSYSSLC
jgi:hypothetical protein